MDDPTNWTINHTATARRTAEAACRRIKALEAANQKESGGSQLTTQDVPQVREHLNLATVHFPAIVGVPLTSPLACDLRPLHRRSRKIEPLLEI